MDSGDVNVFWKQDDESRANCQGFTLYVELLDMVSNVQGVRPLTKYENDDLSMNVFCFIQCICTFHVIMLVDSNMPLSQIF